MAPPSKLIWIVAAGTGGHIFPGVALAKNLKKHASEIEFEFFGTSDRLESKLIPEAGFSLVTLNAKPWKGKNPLTRVAGLVLLTLTFFKVFFYALKRKPKLLVSVGGYVSVPVVLASCAAGVPVFLIEPNIRAGVANVLLSRLAERAFTTPGADALKKFHCQTVDSGNPTREGFVPQTLRTDVKRILVLGGSQGAKKLCELTLRAYSELGLASRGVEMLLQSGAGNYDYASQLARQLNLGDLVRVQPFIDHVADELKLSDLVLARAGAMTIAELSLTGLPTIFVPFPFAADDHQRVNVRLLVDSGAAAMIDEMTSMPLEALKQTILNLSSDDGHLERRAQLQTAFLKWARPDALDRMTEQVLSRLGKSR